VVRLSNPNSGGMDQTVYDLMQVPATAWMVSGPFNLDLVIRDLRANIPLFRDSYASPEGFARNPNFKAIWVAFDGEMGSGIVLFPIGAEGAKVWDELEEHSPNLPKMYTQSFVVNGEIDDYPASHLAGANALEASNYL
jgi:hypothetical protein